MFQFQKERALAVSSLSGYLEDRSSIVKTHALQGLVDLAQHEPNIRHRVIEILRQAARSGTPAVKARSRKLLIQLDCV
jgi:HEAT repeat protein